MISVVRGARLDQRLTIDELAEKAGVHPKTIRRIESRHTVSDATIQEVATALDIAPSAIAGDLVNGPRVIRTDFRADGVVEQDAA